MLDSQRGEPSGGAPRPLPVEVARGGVDVASVERPSRNATVAAVPDSGFSPCFTSYGDVSAIQMNLKVSYVCSRIFAWT